MLVMQREVDGSERARLTILLLMPNIIRREVEVHIPARRDNIHSSIFLIVHMSDFFWRISNGQPFDRPACRVVRLWTELVLHHCTLNIDESKAGL